MPLPPIPAIADRLAAGKAVRKACARSVHAEPGVFERDPVELITSSSEGRIERLIPLRYGRMLANPFAFFRGTALLQAADLATAPSTGITVQACGDCHLSNFGGFGTPERQLLFDITDFDETWPAPFEWDLKRLVASFVVASRHLRMGDEAGVAAVARAVGSYQQHIAEYAGMSEIDVWYDHVTFDRVREGASKGARARIDKTFERAAKRGHEELLPKLGEKIDGRWVLRDNLPTVFHIRGDTSLLSPDDPWRSAANIGQARGVLFGAYADTLTSDRRLLLERHRFQDVAFKVVGVGSVGMRCLVALLVDSEERPLFLQIKHANPSVLAGRAPGKHKVAHEGQRVVEGQRLTQASSDIFLGWLTGPTGRPFYVRQLRDMKISAEVETFDEDALVEYAGICGWILARAHAKSSGRSPEISGYMGQSGAFAEALASYAVAYADQVDRDFDQFARACRQGVLPITTEEAFQQDLVA